MITVTADRKLSKNAKQEQNMEQNDETLATGRMWKSDVGNRQAMPSASLLVQLCASICYLPCNRSNNAPSTFVYLDRQALLFLIAIHTRNTRTDVRSTLRSMT